MLPVKEMDGYRRLNVRIAALDVSRSQPVAVELQAGRTVRVVGTARDSGLVDIICDGRGYSVFHVDLIQRSYAVKAAGKEAD
jgi:hypothetical protein